MSEQAANPADDPANAIADTPGGCVIQIKVIPRAPQTMIDGMRGGALLVKLGAPPVEGQANESLLRFIAHICDVPRRAVALMSGERIAQQGDPRQSRDARARRPCASGHVRVVALSISSTWMTKSQG